MDDKPNFGLIGLGTMGAALALNLADQNVRLAVYNRTASVTEKFIRAAGDLRERLVPAETLEAFVAAIAAPRNIILMLPAGDVVDAQIAALRPLLGKDDLIIDAGNANFADTERRTHEAQAEGPGFLGIGVSGGEEGARHGPSIMAGGTREQWQRIGPVLECIAARYHDTPCAALMGPGGAGHYVKMVHNGIEYADMQMIAETYAIMRDGLALNAMSVADAFDGFNAGLLASYLIEISGKVARVADPVSGAPLLDMILDAAGQKGTGRWTAIEAQKLAVPVPVIEAAVTARNLSSRVTERARGERVFGAPSFSMDDAGVTLDTLEKALIAGKILCYAHGFEMLKAAGQEFGWPLPMSDIAKVWRAGCIIRSDMLNDMAKALQATPKDNLIFAAPFEEMIKAFVPALRKTVIAATQAGIAVPALAAGLFWFDTMRTSRTPANMIQAQRDFFGAHGYARTDGVDAPHGPWGSAASQGNSTSS